MLVLVGVILTNMSSSKERNKNSNCNEISFSMWGANPQVSYILCVSIYILSCVQVLASLQLYFFQNVKTSNFEVDIIIYTKNWTNQVDLKEMLFLKYWWFRSLVAGLCGNKVVLSPWTLWIFFLQGKLLNLWSSIPFLLPFVWFMSCYLK